MTTQPTTSPHQHEPYELEGIKFFSKSLGKEMILCTDETRPENGWLCYKHPDGQWVTLRIATQADREELARAHESPAMTTNDQPHAEVTPEMNELCFQIYHSIRDFDGDMTDAQNLLADFCAKREVAAIASCNEEEAATGDHNLVPSLQAEISALTAKVVKLTERAEKAEADYEGEHEFRKLATQLAGSIDQYMNSDSSNHGERQNAMKQAIAEAKMAGLLK